MICGWLLVSARVAQGQRTAREEVHDEHELGHVRKRDAQCVLMCSKLVVDLKASFCQ